MTVFVDPLMACTPWGTRKRYRTVSHLIADTRAELVAFAVDQLGLRLEWIQDAEREGRLTHFDLTPAKRQLAVARGAVEIDRREMGRRIRAARRRARVPVPTPAETGCTCWHCRRARGEAPQVLPGGEDS